MNNSNEQTFPRITEGASDRVVVAAKREGRAIIGNTTAIELDENCRDRTRTARLVFVQVHNPKNDRYFLITCERRAHGRRHALKQKEQSESVGQFFQAQ